jgi:glycerol-3-phosphate acyltransferase PlsY
MITFTTIFGLLIAYLIGSVPTGVWISRYFYKIDIREFGSGNAGATNTFRVLGKRAGIVVMALDIFKGFLAVRLATMLGNYDMGSEQFVNYQLSLGIAAVFGHLFPIYVGFRGGKGVATLLGMILAIHPEAALICFGIFLISLVLTSYVSLSSILASIAFPLVVIVYFDTPVPSLQVFGIAIAILVLTTHQKNIERLVKGEENRAKLFRRKK